VVPNGPDGIPAFDTLTYFPLSKSETDPKTGVISAPFNYTLELQGLSSNIKCFNDTTESPISFWAVPGGTPFVYQYNGTCPSGREILTDTFILPNSNNTLGFWACDTSSPGGSEQYKLYLRGRVNYEPSIGNITCTVSSIQPAIFAVTYQSRSDSFSTQFKSTAAVTNASSELTQRAITALATVVYNSQSAQSNLLAESVISLGLSSFELPPYNQSETYLQLYAAMFQGMIEYEVCSNILLRVPLLQYPTVGNIYPPVVLDTYQSASASLLRPQRGWVCNRQVAWLVRNQCKYWFLDADNACQSGFLDTYPPSYVHGEESSL
jgi:hypothetical protein